MDNANATRNKRKGRRGLKSARGKSRTTNASLFQGDRDVVLMLPRSRLIIPDSYITNLRYMHANNVVINQAGLTYASIRFRPTSPYDVDPVIASTATPGFAELSGLYGRYRVISAGIRTDFTNLEKFPVYCMIFVSNFDLGSNYAQVGSMIGNSRCKWRQISPSTGMDHTVLSLNNVTHGEVVGSDSAYFDDSYSAVVTTNPTDNFFFNVAVWTGGPNNLLNGVQTMITIDMQVKFYEAFHLVT